MDEENTDGNRKNEGKRKKKRAEENPEPTAGKRFFKYRHLRGGEVSDKPRRMWTNTTKIVTEKSLHPTTKEVMITYNLVGYTYSQQFTPLFSEREPRTEGTAEGSQSSHSSQSSSSKD